MIKSFISEICTLLGIKCPGLSYDTSGFESETMLAQIDSKGTTMHLKKYANPNPDQFFAIAHELRHKWQIDTDKQKYFANYKPLKLCASIDEYNLQLAEIDAHAFAGIVMASFFRLKPLFQGLSQTVKDKITERMEYLKTTEFND